MKLWTTEIVAKDPRTGRLCLWVGPNVPGETIKDAARYCQENGLGYCRIEGQFIQEFDLPDGDIVKLFLPKFRDN